MTETLDSRPLVTVAMVTYNSAAYVRAAIGSVLCSSYEHFELLISDDNSTDDTWEIIRSFDDPRIRTFRNEKNLGEYPNRDQCVRLAAGQYLIFIDGDDMVYPHGLEFMVRMLDAFPNCAMGLMCWYRNYLVYPVILSPRQFYIGEYFGHGVLGTAFSNILFRTQVLREAGTLAAGFTSGDDYIRYKIALQHHALLMNDGLTWWRETPGQAFQTHQRSGRLFVDAYKLKFRFLAEAGCPLSATEKQEARDNLFTALARQAWRSILRLDRHRLRLIFGELGLPLGYMFRPMSRLVEKFPFEGSSPSHPVALPFDRHPYSKCPRP